MNTVKVDNVQKVEHIYLHNNHAGELLEEDVYDLAPNHTYSMGDCLVIASDFDVDVEQDLYIASILTPDIGWYHIEVESIEDLYRQILIVVRSTNSRLD